MIDFNLDVEHRANKGSSASRSLRRAQMIPGILYGGDTQEAQLISVKKIPLETALNHEAFFSHIITLILDGKKQPVILRALQRHPVKSNVIHVDFQRVSQTKKITMNIPLHLVGEAPGLKQGGSLIQAFHQIEVSCLAKDLPEFINVDVSHLGLSESVHLFDLKLPANVELATPVTSAEDPHNHTVVTVQAPKAEAAVEETPAAAAPAAPELVKQKTESAAQVAEKKKQTVSTGKK